MSYAYYNTIILPIKRNIQDNDYDCGPASIKIIIETLGIKKEASEKELMKVCDTNSKDGTEPHALSKALDKLTISHFVSHDTSLEKVEESLRNLCLCIVLYQSWGENGDEFQNLSAGHYSVIFGYDRHHFYLADPYKKHTQKNKQWGFRKIKKDLFAKRWNAKISEDKNNHHWMMSVPLKNI